MGDDASDAASWIEENKQNILCKWGLYIFNKILLYVSVDLWSWLIFIITVYFQGRSNSPFCTVRIGLQFSQPLAMYRGELFAVIAQLTSKCL